MGESFENLCRLYEALERLNSRNEIIDLMSGYFKQLTCEELEAVVRLSTTGFEEALNVSWATVVEALKGAYDFDLEEFRKAFDETGDVGSAVKAVLERRQGPRQTLLAFKPLTVTELYSSLREISRVKGPGSRTKRLRMLKGVFGKTSPPEVKYLVRILLGDLRIGVKEGLVARALAKAFQVPYDVFEKAFMLSGDLAETALTAKVKGVEGLLGTSYRPFNPIKPMLAGMAYSVREVLDEFKGEAAFEYKLDGARVQIHFFDGRVRVFSRRLKDVTVSLPEVVAVVKKTPSLENCVLEGEVVAVDSSGRPLPFQELMHRFKRVKGVEEEARRLPVRLYLFDILVADGVLTIDMPYLKRRRLLVEKAGSIPVVDCLITQDIEEAERFYKSSLEMGHEGLVAKRLGSTYHPGVRGRDWLKVKATLDNLDLVIVGGEYGYGRRYRWISDYYLAALDPSTGGFAVVGKTFKGLTDTEFEGLTRILKKDIVRREGRRVWVNPRVVVEVAYNEVQKSPKYPSGFALRFARIVRIRWDKRVEEADTIDRVREIYRKQFERKSMPP
ncbi:MAG: DNA ligase [Candidatus Bathyarchaeota archaeon B24]|nr:MAG: DNA ligase [Candidatus Bathyarchaeota archaeon B24]